MERKKGKGDKTGDFRSELPFILSLAEEREALEPVLRRLAEVEQERNRTSALLDAVLEETRNLSGEERGSG